MIVKKKEIRRTCSECGSDYYAASSPMQELCPECAHFLYGYKNCPHDFQNGRCIKCHWDGSTSEYIKTIKDKT